MYMYPLNKIEACVDMDEWNHSWHMDITESLISGSPEQAKCIKIITEKIAEREAEIKQLTEGLQILKT